MQEFEREPGINPIADHLGRSGKVVGELVGRLIDENQRLRAEVAHLQARNDTLSAEIATLHDDLYHASLQAVQGQRDKRTLTVQAEELRARAETDPLTGLGSLYGIERWSRQHYEPKMREHDGLYTFAILSFDVKKFKLVNDLLGYDSGNTVLSKVGDVLKSSVRAKSSEDAGQERRTVSDVQDAHFFRPGGDEFMVILDIGAQQQAERDQIVARVLERIQRNFKTSTQPEREKLHELLLAQQIETLETLSLHQGYVFNEPEERFDDFYNRALRLFTTSKKKSTALVQATDSAGSGKTQA